MESHRKDESLEEENRALSSAHRAQSARYSSLESRLMDREKDCMEAKKREKQLSQEVNIHVFLYTCTDSLYVTLY